MRHEPVAEAGCRPRDPCGWMRRRFPGQGWHASSRRAEANGRAVLQGTLLLLGQGRLPGHDVVQPGEHSGVAERVRVKVTVGAWVGHGLWLASISMAFARAIEGVCAAGEVVRVGDALVAALAPRMASARSGDNRRR